MVISLIQTKRIGALFCGASEVIGCFKGEAERLFPVTGCRKLTEVYDEGKLCTFYEKCVAREVTADVPGEDGWVIWLESVAGMTDKASL